MLYLIKHILFVIWFFAPAGLANIAAFLTGKITYLKRYNYPLDGYLKYRKKRVFGNHKTLRGLIGAVAIGISICCIQVLLYRLLPWISWFVLIKYDEINPFLLGGLLGMGDIAGDAIKSFFKRQRGIIPGRSWFPFDQLDYIIGGVIFSLIYIRLSFLNYLLLCIVWFLLHPLTTFVGYIFKLRRKPI